MTNAFSVRKFVKQGTTFKSRNKAIKLSSLNML